MTNYEKAKEDGIKSFKEVNKELMLVASEEIEIINDFLSSFAEKIKEGVEKDRRETLTVDKLEYPKETMDLINKLLSPDSPAKSGE